jgi:hypothetical protein
MNQALDQASQPDLKAVVEAYLQAFDAQDVERCLAFFNDDATVDFQMAVYRGRDAIADWHRDRFAANLKMARLDSISVKGSTVVVNGVVTSKRLAAWNVKALSGRVTMGFANGKIQTGKLTARITNPLHTVNAIRGV